MAKGFLEYYLMCVDVIDVSGCVLGTASHAPTDLGS